jgi:hypothetical protein
MPYDDVQAKARDAEHPAQQATRWPSDLFYSVLKATMACIMNTELLGT